MNPLSTPGAGMERSKPRKFAKVWRDDDGWWGLLPSGWNIDGCTGVREDTRRTLMKRLPEAQPGANH